MNLPALSVRHPQTLATLLVALIVWGSIAFTTLPRQEEPVLTWRLANVITRLPGAAPQRMESLVTDLLERYVEQVDEVEHIYSVSRAGLSLLQVELSDDVTVAAPVWQKVRHKLSEAAGELPPGVIGPDLDDEIMGTFAELIAISSDSATYRQLKDHAQRLEDQLRYLPTTASTALFGVQQEEIRVELDPAKLATYDLSFQSVAAAVRNRNTRRPSGRMRVGDQELLIEASGEFTADEQVRQMVLMVTLDGRTVRLGDVGTVSRTTCEPAAPLARINGQRAVVVGVRARQNVRIDSFGARVRQILDQFEAGLPAGVRCTLFHDLAKYTEERGEQLTWNFISSGLLLFFATAFFMGWRSAAIVGATIPLTCLIAFLCFSTVGIPLNEMSVMSLIIAFGILVDNTIIVTEEIRRQCDGSVPLETLAIRESGQLFVPLVVATLTTMVAFVPIYLLPGGVGEFVRAIPIGVGVCVSISLVVSITVVPWLCVRVFAGARYSADELPSPVGLMARYLGPFGRVCQRLLRRAVERPAVAVAVIVAISAGCGASGLLLRRDFFSPVQRDQFVVDVFALQGSALRHTAELVAQIEGVLREDEAVVTVASFVGRNAPLVFYNLESQETYANHFAQLVVGVKDWRLTAPTAQRVQAALDAKIVGADCCAHILEHGAPFVAPFEIRISGDSIPTLCELGRRAKTILQQTPGVRNIRDNYGSETTKLSVEVNEPVARRIGIDQGTVADELRARLDGVVADYVQEGDERIDITLRLPAADRQGIADLTSVYFKPNPQAASIPFSSVATLVPLWEAPSIYRRDGRRTLSVLAYPQFGLTAAEVSKRFIPALAALTETLPPGYALKLGGENEQRHEAESNLMGKSVYAVFLIILLIVAEFRSFRITALIAATMPVSVGTALLGLYLTGWPLNFMAMMGMLIVIGVAVDEAVVLVDGFERERRPDVPLREVVVDVTLNRWRHVTVTTVADVAGLLPVAMSASLLWPPLAIAIIAGLSLETAAVFFGVPAGYVLLCGHHRPAGDTVE